MEAKANVSKRLDYIKGERRGRSRDEPPSLRRHFRGVYSGIQLRSSHGDCTSADARLSSFTASRHDCSSRLDAQLKSLEDKQEKKKVEVRRTSDHSASALTTECVGPCCAR